MTWSLSATGHAIVEDVEGAVQALEAELVEELHKVLSNPRWGTIASHFGGSVVTSDVHTAAAQPERPDANTPAGPAEAPASDPAAADQTQTAAPAADVKTAPEAPADAPAAEDAAGA